MGSFQSDFVRTRFYILGLQTVQMFWNQILASWKKVLSRPTYYNELSELKKPRCAQGFAEFICPCSVNPLRWFCVSWSMQKCSGSLIDFIMLLSFSENNPELLKYLKSFGTEQTLTMTFSFKVLLYKLGHEAAHLWNEWPQPRIWQVFEDSSSQRHPPCSHFCKNETGSSSSSYSAGLQRTDSYSSQRETGSFSSSCFFFFFEGPPQGTCDLARVSTWPEFRSRGRTYCWANWTWKIPLPA